MKNRTFIVEPYIFWKGHYKQYFENLLSSKNYYIYCDTEDRNYLNSFFTKAFIGNCENNFTQYILCRLKNSYRANRLLRSKVKENDLIHFIEFEPLNFILFELLTYFKKKKAVLTIHSIESMTYHNKIKNMIALIQRMVYRMGLKLAKKRNYTFVVHYEEHCKQLQEIVGPCAKIKVIEYPSPAVIIDKPKSLKAKKLLIFGQIREDKGFYEFLSQEPAKQLTITIAGKIYDERIKSLFGVKNYTFIDQFVSNSELTELFGQHDFLLLPYGKNYTGGAGPLKDSFAFATPVITSSIPIFKEIIDKYGTGYYFNAIEEIQEKIEAVSEQKYIDYSKNCIEYASTHGWNYMRKEYFKLYRNLQ